MSSHLQNSGANNYIEYQISLVDCHGQALALPSSPIIFNESDYCTLLGGLTNCTANSVSYQIAAGGSVTSGKLVDVPIDASAPNGWGGVAWKTDKSASPTAGINTLSLKISYPANSSFSFDAAIAAPGQGPSQMAVAFQYGQSTPAIDLVALNR